MKYLIDKDLFIKLERAKYGKLIYKFNPDVLYNKGDLVISSNGVVYKAKKRNKSAIINADCYYEYNRLRVDSINFLVQYIFSHSISGESERGKRYEYYAYKVPNIKIKLSPRVVKVDVILKDKIIVSMENIYAGSSDEIKDVEILGVSFKVSVKDHMFNVIPSIIRTEDYYVSENYYVFFKNRGETITTDLTVKIIEA